MLHHPISSLLSSGFWIQGLIKVTYMEAVYDSFTHSIMENSLWIKDQAAKNFSEILNVMASSGYAEK